MLLEKELVVIPVRDISSGKSYHMVFPRESRFEKFKTRYLIAGG
jgi:hypothetical protein